MLVEESGCSIIILTGLSTERLHDGELLKGSLIPTKTSRAPSIDFTHVSIKVGPDPRVWIEDLNTGQIFLAAHSTNSKQKIAVVDNTFQDNWNSLLNLQILTFQYLGFSGQLSWKEVSSKNLSSENIFPPISNIWWKMSGFCKNILLISYFVEMLSYPPTTKISPSMTAWPWESRLLMQGEIFLKLLVSGLHTSFVEKSSLRHPAIW